MNIGSENNVFGIHAKVHILESRPRKKERESEFFGVIGQDVRVDPSLLERYCFASPSTAAIDFVTVLGAVRFADRAVKRRHSIGWARNLELVVPVFDKSKWSSSRTTRNLEDCLSYLTGDKWAVSFTKRRKRKALGSGHIDHLVKPPKAQYVGVPYSDGVDSYAQAKLLLEREPQTHLICTFTDYKGGVQSWDSLCSTRQAELKNIYSIPVPFRVVEPHHAEVSFRSRPFIFYSLAAYGAALVGSSRVLIPENGQGSIGGSLVLLGNEAPHRSCYPGFLVRLSNLLTDLLGQKIVFEHPGLLKTKGQVIAALSRLESHDVWGAKRSCSHDQRHATVNGRRVHCGVCGGCVLRRVSMLAAGIEDKSEYLFSNLHAKTIEGAVSHDVKVKAMDAMKDVAGNSMRDMQRLADLALKPDDARLKEVALDISDANGTPPKAALEGVQNLLTRHQQEWNSFIQRCGSDSWIAALAMV